MKETEIQSEREEDINLLHSVNFNTCNWRLAKRIGETEMHLLVMIHYWTTLNHDALHKIEDRFWIGDTLEGWVKKFHGVKSLKTIQRAFDSLKEQELIFTKSLFSNKLDRTNWYSLNYDKVNLIILEIKYEEMLEKRKI